jgi:hypothetical protein
MHGFVQIAQLLGVVPDKLRFGHDFLELKNSTFQPPQGQQSSRVRAIYRKNRSIQSELLNPRAIP